MNGTATVSSNGQYHYTPRSGFTGRDSFTVDGCLPANTAPVCGSGTVTVTVLPVALPDTADVPAGQLTEVRGQDNDIGNAVSVTVVSPPAHGTAEAAPSGSIEYQSDPAYAGRDALRYQVCSMVSPDVCALAAVTLTVRPAPLAPAAPGSLRRPVLPTPGTAVGWLLGWALAGLLIAAGTLAFATRRLRGSPQ